MKILIAVMLMLTSAAAFSQAAKKDSIFYVTESAPEYPGGTQAFYQFIGKYYKYPDMARENNVKGKLIMSFVVDQEGALVDFKTIQGLGFGCEEELIRVLKGSPKWTPGMQNGRNVRVQYRIPLNLDATPPEEVPPPAAPPVKP